MGCQVSCGILKEDKTLTDIAKQKFIDEVKDIIINGTENAKIPTPFGCGDPIPPCPDARPEDFNLEDEKKFPDFHKNVLKEQYEKMAASLDVDSTFSLLPAFADPIALGGAMGVNIPSTSFPTGYLPYFTGALIPKFAMDLIDAGVTDYIPPPALVPKLLQLVKLPKPPPVQMPPQVSLPLPVPNIPTPPLPQLPAFDMPSPPLPPVPTPFDVLPDYVDLQIAMATGIPNLLVQIIGKMPTLLPKIASVKDIMAEICGMVRDSGLFGNIRSTSTIQQAATIVLARKTSECLFHASMASTIGVSPGSATAAVAKEIEGYEPLQKQPAQKAITPIDKVLRYARSMTGVSYGKNFEEYCQNILYYESAISSLPHETGTGDQKVYINMYGDFISGPDVKQIAPGAPLPNLDGPGPNNYAVQEPAGFKKFVGMFAADASSCAMFVRSCYYNGGSMHKFFLSFYPGGQAINGVRSLAVVKNYNWIIEDNGAYKFNEDLAKYVSTSNLRNSLAGWFATEPSSDGDVVPQDQTLRKHYISDPSKRCFISENELFYRAKKKDFPQLDAGDAVYVASPNNREEHVMLVTQRRDAGWTKNSEEVKYESQTQTLKPPIIGIEGGATDCYNKGGIEYMQQSETYKGRILQAPPEYALPDDEGKFYIEGDSVYQISNVQQGLIQVAANIFSQKNYVSVDVTESLKVGKPTAILGGRYDACSIENGSFMIGSYQLTLSNGTVLGNPGPNPAPARKLKKIQFILKGENFLDSEILKLEEENEKETDQKKRQVNESKIKAYYQMIYFIDELPFIAEQRKLNYPNKKGLATLLWPTAHRDKLSSNGESAEDPAGKSGG